MVSEDEIKERILDTLMEELLVSSDLISDSLRNFNFRQVLDISNNNSNAIFNRIK